MSIKGLIIYIIFLIIMAIIFPPLWIFYIGVALINGLRR